ncbi:MAG: ACT domain-containing protein, partial [Alphaproteobacteria bacterium]|nr:ACT domain-containing protein [Alphaproteobacteria bacterium]
ATKNPLFGLDQVVATPHLGASTSEAQENVAIQVAEQMAAYLKTGSVTNALNMPSVSAEDAVRLKPYLELSAQLGSFAGQITESGLKSIRIEYEGHVAGLNTRPLTAVVIEGVLKPLTDGVNMVNAPVIAKERGITVSETKHDREGDYHTLIRVTVTTDRRERSIAGTLFGSHPRVVELHGVKLEAGLGKRMLYVNNEDKPGLIGKLGKVLGDAKVNIANFHLGRGEKKGDAVALVEVDNAVTPALMEKISKLPSVKQAKLLTF